MHRLVLPSVRLSDAGEYTAVAGSSMSKADLAVEGRDVKISEPASREITVSSQTLVALHDFCFALYIRLIRILPNIFPKFP